MSDRGPSVWGTLVATWVISAGIVWFREETWIEASLRVVIASVISVVLVLAWRWVARRVGA